MLQRNWPVLAQSTGNREQRREQKRLERMAPRKSRQPGMVAVNNLERAKHFATRLTNEERADVMRLAHEGFNALREGVATWLQWSYMSSAVSVALAIEAQGVVRGMREHFSEAQKALDNIFSRTQQGINGAKWGRTTLYFYEIDSLREAVNLHDFQLRQLSFAELKAALAAAERDVRTAGGAVLNAKALPPTAQQTEFFE